MAKGWYNDSTRHALASKGIKTKIADKVEGIYQRKKELVGRDLSVDHKLFLLQEAYREYMGSTPETIEKRQLTMDEWIQEFPEAYEKYSGKRVEGEQEEFTTEQQEVEE